MRIKNCFLLALVAALTSGCATLGPQYTDSKIDTVDDPIIILYRTYSFAGAGYTAHITFNDTKTIKLQSKSFFKVQLKPGQYKIKRVNHNFILDTGKDEEEITISTEPGRQYFIKYEDKTKLQITGLTALPLISNPKIQFTVMPQDMAKGEIQGLHEAQQ